MSDIDHTSRTRGRIILIDDHAIVRAGLRDVLRPSGHNIVAEYSDLEEIHDAKGLNERVDIILLDLNLQTTRGIRTLEIAKSMFDKPAIIVYSALDDMETIARAYHMGVDGYIPKAGYGEKEVLDALEQVLNGGTYTVPALSGELVKFLSQGGGSQKPKGCLTTTEYRIFMLLRQGLSYEDIAEALGLGVETVRSRSSRIRRKLGLVGSDFWRRVPIDWVYDDETP